MTKHIEETTRCADIEAVRAGFKRGTICGIHAVGEYVIVEAVVRYTHAKSAEVIFHGYIGRKSIGRHWYSLDEALLGVIAYKYDGCNTQADSLFARALGINPVRETV